MKDLILPLSQSIEFERTCNTLGSAARRFDAASGTCLVQSRKLPVIGSFHLISRGPVLAAPQELPHLMAEIRDTLRGPLIVNARADQAAVGGMKVAGGAELAIADLIEPAQMRDRLNAKWRNQLKKAEKSSLVIVDQPLDPKRHQWFLEAEQKQQKTRRYRGYPTGFLLAFAHANKGKARLYTAMLNGEAVAAMLVLKHGRMASYQAGVTTDDGRRLCAHNLILWTIMCDLQRRKTVQLDLGRADLSDGLQRFKLGAGARLETLPGSFLIQHWRTRRNRARPGDRAIIQSTV